MILFLPKTIKDFIYYIDLIIKEYRDFPFSLIIKNNLIDLLKKAYKQNKIQFNEFANKTDKYYWVLAQASVVAFDMVATGYYHLMNKLNYEGEQLQKFYFHCLKLALEKNYIDIELYEQQKNNFVKQVSETGKFA